MQRHRSNQVESIILSRVKWQPALVYLDDIIMYLKPIMKHLVYVPIVATLRKYCQGGAETVKVLFL